MGLLIDIFDFLVEQLGIDLGGRDIGMTQHTLDGTDICPVFQKMSRKGMTKSMRCDFALYPRHVGVSFNYFPKALA